MPEPLTEAEVERLAPLQDTLYELAAERAARLAAEASLAEWQRVGSVVQEAATGRPGPLSDSDVVGEIAALRVRAQAAEADAARVRAALQVVADPAGRHMAGERQAAWDAIDAWLSATPPPGVARVQAVFDAARRVASQRDSAHMFSSVSNGDLDALDAALREAGVHDASA